jgi:hypothetical protein
VVDSEKVTTKNQHISANNTNILISVIMAIDCFTASTLDVAIVAYKVSHSLTIIK